ncbi:MAG: hypothetical protein DME22_02050 [Verrucomicrobia bacterium]|nr:MAG: hypothetical protein DME22_02050 [Verrucomicrobiota bacterium]
MNLRNAERRGVLTVAWRGGLRTACPTLRHMKSETSFFVRRHVKLASSILKDSIIRRVLIL